mmetsp:Transcript_100576/g.290495  ORF Transcript_100576/g.290495 Transcript_100576/m.290495 type:complete len:280 (-) Transcript_100576:188-1027(-)
MSLPNSANADFCSLAPRLPPEGSFAIAAFNNLKRLASSSDTDRGSTLSLRSTLSTPRSPPLTRANRMWAGSTCLACIFDASDMALSKERFAAGVSDRSGDSVGMMPLGRPTTSLTTSLAFRMRTPNFCITFAEVPLLSTMIPRRSTSAPMMPTPSRFASFLALAMAAIVPRLKRLTSIRIDAAAGLEEDEEEGMAGSLATGSSPPKNEELVEATPPPVAPEAGSLLFRGLRRGLTFWSTHIQVATKANRARGRAVLKTAFVTATWARVEAAKRRVTPTL